MKPYGSKRTLGNCRTKCRKSNGKILVIEFIKNKKFGRKFKIES